MLERTNELKLDPVFSEKFFEFNEEKSFSVNVDFPLPPAADMLQEYFSSPEGIQFKAGFSGLVDKLAVWSAANGLNAAACERFKNTYVNYSGSQADVNKLYIALYQQGVPALAGVVNLMGSDTIQLDYRKDKIRNLLESIQVCAPGTHTNITDTYLELLACSNLAMKWVAQRRKICEQVVLELLKPSRLNTGMEIHYVNAVLNRYADALAINMMQDQYVGICAVETLDALCDSFRSKVNQALTLEAVIENIISESELDLRKMNLTPEKFNDQLKELEHKLNHYGTEEERKGMFSSYEIFATNEGEICVPVRFSWHADYVVYSSVANRLKRSGYINPAGMQKTAVENTNLYVLPARSLKLAYVEVPQQDSQISPFRPFIPHCVEMLTASEEQNRRWLQVITEYKFTRNQSFEIVEGIIQYINSFEYANRNDKDALLARLIKTIHDILMCEYKWDVILRALPEAGKRLFLDGFGKEKIPGLIKDADQLVTIMKLTPAETLALLISAVAADVLQSIRQDGWKIINVLRTLDEAQRAAFLVAIDPKALNIIFAATQSAIRLTDVLSLLPIKHRGALLKLYDRDAFVKLIDGDSYSLLRVLDLIPELQRNKFLLKLGPQGISVVKLNGFNLAKVIAMLPIENRAPYLFKFSPERLRTVTETAYVAEGMLNVLPDENRYALLRLIGLEGLRNLLNPERKSSFCSIVSALPEYNRAALLQDVGVDALLKIFDERAVVDTFLPQLPVIDRIRFLYEISLVTHGYVKSADHLLKLFNQIPEQSRSTLMHLNIVTIDICRAHIKSIQDLVDLVRLFPQNYRKKFYSELGLELLRNVIKQKEELITVLELLPASDHREFFSETKELWKTQVPDIGHFIFFVQTLAQQNYGDFLNALEGGKILSLLQTSNDLASVLNALPTDKRADFLLTFCADFLPQIFKDLSGLMVLLESIPPQSWGRFFNKLGAAELVNIIKDAAGMNQLLKSIPATAYSEVMQALGADQCVKIIPDYHELIKAAKGLTVTKQAVFHSTIEPVALRRIVKSVREFNVIYRSQSKENIAVCLNKYIGDLSDENLRSVISDREELMYVLYRSVPADRVKILDRLGGACLQKLLLLGRNAEAALKDVGDFAQDPGHFDALILATIRAYREQRASNPSANLHWYGSLFRAPDRDKKIAEADRLDAAIRSGDYNYLDKLTTEQRKVVENGELGQIVSAFRSGYSRFTRTPR